MHRVYDGGGAATTLAFDFEGQPIEEARQLFASKTEQPDWSPLLEADTLAAMTAAAASLLEAETFSASSTRDALGRVLAAVSPDGSSVRYAYDEGGQLQRVTLNHRGSDATQTLVDDIRYDAKARRSSVTSPSSITRYPYDPVSQRLIRLRTVRTSDDAVVQSLHYHYDPVGNVTDIRDTAQATVYFANAVVEAGNSYEYDRSTDSSKPPAASTRAKVRAINRPSLPSPSTHTRSVEIADARVKFRSADPDRRRSLTIGGS